jgi:hypothetical protein
MDISVDYVVRMNIEGKDAEIYFDSPEEAASFVAILIKNEVRFTLDYEDVEAMEEIAEAMHKQQMEESEEE